MVYLVSDGYINFYTFQLNTGVFGAVLKKVNTRLKEPKSP
jgi:hypothetical protein